MPNVTCTSASPSAFSIPGKPARLGLDGFGVYASSSEKTTAFFLKNTIVFTCCFIDIAVAANSDSASSEPLASPHSASRVVVALFVEAENKFASPAASAELQFDVLAEQIEWFEPLDVLSGPADPVGRRFAAPVATFADTCCSIAGFAGSTVE